VRAYHKTHPWGVCCWLVLIILCCAGAAPAEEWKELRAEHFLVYYFEDEKFAQDVLNQAEKYYQKIASDIGYVRYDNFWQWDNRAKIYIYRTHEDFMKAMGKPPWVFGTVLYDEKKIISYRWNEGFTDALLPHEIAHLVFREFVGFKNEVPIWMDEGVAQWEEKKRREWAVGVVKELVKDRDYIPLARLTQMDLSTEHDSDLSRKLYSQAASLVGFLMTEYGGSKFTLFCRQLRDGKNINDALSFVYTGSIPNIDELEKKWVKYYGGD